VMVPSGYSEVTLIGVGSLPDHPVIVSAAVAVRGAAVAAPARGPNMHRQSVAVTVAIVGIFVGCMAAPLLRDPDPSLVSNGGLPIMARGTASGKPERMELARSTPRAVLVLPGLVAEPGACESPCVLRGAPGPPSEESCLVVSPPACSLL
jgi:hypothetical protein